MKLLDKLANFIVKARYYFLAFFLLATIGCGIIAPMVGVNYDMTKYLPEESGTRVALEIMEDEFGATGNASVMISNASLDQINQLADQLAAIEGISTVAFDPTNPSYYNGTDALLKIFFTSGDYDIKTTAAIEDMKKVLEGYDTAMGGSAITGNTNSEAIGSELTIILLIAIAVVILILLLTSRSWLEPLVYVCVIACAILMNMGTNLILGEISFITQSISAIMLIALEMDYCIILCHRYREEFDKCPDAKTAMSRALAGSFMPILASSLTVMAGLLSLTFMDFSIGFDIGMVLAKGVLISIFAVLFFMPSVIMLFSKGMQKTKHRSFLPRMDKVATFAKKTRFVLPALFLGVVVAALVIQTGVQFSYVVTTPPEGSDIQAQQQRIEETFGKQNNIVIMVPKGDPEKEKELYNYVINLEIEGEKYINSATSLTSTPLYDKMTYAQVREFGLDNTAADAIFAAAGKDPTTGYVYTIDIINYCHTNNTVISGIAAAKQSQIEAGYQQMAVLYLDLNVEMMKLTLELDETTAKAVLAGVLGKEPGQITAQDSAPAWKVIKYLNDNVPGMSENPQIAQAINSPAYTLLTANSIVEQYGLPASEVDALFAMLNKNPQTDSVYLLEIVKLLHDNNTIISGIAQEMQATIDATFTQAQASITMFSSENYSRLIFNLNLAIDDEKAFKFINTLNENLPNYFATHYMVNETYNMIETMDVFKSDRLKTDLITILAILLIVLLCFRSLSVPVLLVLAIQGAIWCNLAFATLTAEPVFFVCYLLAMSIQMGATIDYGIVLTDRYVNFRKSMGKSDAMKHALNTSIAMILTSGSILTLAAYTIFFISTVPIIAGIGHLIGRGALISIIVVVLVLPQILLLFDKAIEKTTLKTKFFKEPKPQSIVVTAKEVSTNEPPQSAPNNQTAPTEEKSEKSAKRKIR